MPAVVAICIGACTGALARWQLALWLNTSGATDVATKHSCLANSVWFLIKGGGDGFLDKAFLGAHAQLTGEQPHQPGPIVRGKAS